MKRNLLLALGLSVGTIYGQQALPTKNVDKLKDYSTYLQSKSTNDFIPGYMEFYDYNGSSYDLQSRNDYTYVMSNKVATDDYSYFDGTSLVLNSRDRYEYGTGFTVMTYEIWNSGASSWEPLWVDSTYFDVYNNTTRQVGYSYDNTLMQWDFAYGDVTTHVYNASSQLISSTYSQLDGLGNLYDYSRELWTWTGGTGPSSGVFQNWDDVSLLWVNEMQAISATWFDFQSFDVLYAEVQAWNGTAWENSFEITATYHPNGMMATYLYSGWDGSAYEDESKEEQMIDANGQVTLYESYVWNDMLNDWEYNYGNENTHTYGTDDELLQTDVAFFDFVSGDYAPGFRLVYSDHTNVASLSSEQQSKIALYPNPAVDMVHIELIEVSAFQIYNLSGGLVISGEFNKGLNSIDVSGLVSGMYICTIANDNTTTSLKFVKR